MEGYLIRRKDNGQYLRGARYWRWTRFPRFAACLDHPGFMEWYMGARHPEVEYDVVQVESCRVTVVPK